MNEMKKLVAYILGFNIAFWTMTLFVAVLAFGGIMFVIGLGSFLMWSLPSALPVWTILRASLALGMFIGLWFICEKDGQEMAKSFIKDEYK